MFKRIDHVEIVPGNFERTLSFYTEILGFKIQWRRQVDRAPLKEIIFIELNGTLIELFSVKSPVPASTELWQIGYRRIALEVENMDKTIEYLKSQGVAIVRGPAAAVENLTVAEIRDPDGLSIELIQRG